ncbi:MAG: AsmA family protein, partial [Flavobacterium sp.]|uniref:AsmA family protein n=1 Tax=Flavobacterium sp. TaxID=239 RepID=UPI002637324B
MRTRKQKIFLAVKIVVITFLIMIIALFVFRDALLKQTIAKVSNKMERDYDSSFSIKKASFVGLSGLSFSDIVLVPKNADTLFNIHKMKTSVNLWRLLIGDVQLGTLEIENGYVQLVRNKNGRNFDSFLKKDENATNSKEKRDYAKFTYRIISKVLNLVPTDMKIENLSFRLDDNGKKTTINFEKLRLVNK